MPNFWAALLALPAVMVLDLSSSMAAQGPAVLVDAKAKP